MASRVEHGTGRNGGTSRNVPFFRGTGRDKPIVFKSLSRETVPFFKFCLTVFAETFHHSHMCTFFHKYVSASVIGATFTHAEEGKWV